MAARPAVRKLADDRGWADGLSYLWSCALGMEVRDVIRRNRASHGSGHGHPIQGGGTGVPENQGYGYTKLKAGRHKDLTTDTSKGLLCR
jgi:hypothetical protein